MAHMIFYDFGATSRLWMDIQLLPGIHYVIFINSAIASEYKRIISHQNTPYNFDNLLKSFKNIQYLITSILLFCWRKQRKYEYCATYIMPLPSKFRNLSVQESIRNHSKIRQAGAKLLFSLGNKITLGAWIVSFTPRNNFLQLSNTSNE